MQTYTIQVNTDSDGEFKFSLPPQWANKHLEIVEVINEIGDAQDVNENGYPIGFFEEIFGAFANTPIERPD